jgi:hypothetical protein
MSWNLRRRPGFGAVKKVKPIAPIKKVKPIAPIKAIRPIKPIAPIGYEYYWRDD